MRRRAQQAFGWFTERFPPLRARSICWRWVSIAASGILAGLFAATLTGLLQNTVGILLAELSPVRARLVATGLVGAIAATIALAYGTRSYGLLGLRHFFWYPPLWASVLVGIPTWALLLIGSGSRLDAPTRATAELVLSSPIAYFAVLALAALVQAVLVVVTSTIARRTVLPRPHTRQAGATTFAWIERWIRTDDAVQTIAGDQFGHSLVAERIARHLRGPETSSTVALVGPQGSGKSTIMGFTKSILAADPRFVFVDLSLWPFESYQAAARGILNRLVQALSSRVDTIAIGNLQQHYLDAVKEAGGRFGILSALLADRRSPEQHIETVAQIAIATGLRIVVWIEDVDRFSGGEQPELKRAPIRALLYLLDQSPSIAVVLADSTLDFDIDKVARFIERPPSAPLGNVARLFGVFRSECLFVWPKPTIDPASGGSRARMAALDGTSDMSAEQYRFGDTVVHPEFAICALSTLPRSFKNVLRSTHDSWRRLAGEIDFDDLLIATTIRETSREVFTLLDRNIAAVRAGFKSSFSLSEDKPSEAHGWLQLKAAISKSGDKAELLFCLVYHLFPDLPGSRVNAPTERERPQGLSVDGYWERWTSGASISVEDSDQTTLSEIRAWVQNAESNLPVMLRNGSGAQRVGRFAGNLPTDLGRLLLEVAALDATENASTWGDGSYAPGVVAVWRLALRKPDRDEAMLGAAVRLAIRRHLPSHLPLAKTLHHFFSVEETEASYSLPAAERLAIRETVEEALVESFGGNGPDIPERLLRAAQAGGPWIFYQLCWGLDRIRGKQSSSGQPFIGWASLASSLIRMARLDRSTGVPMILPFITEADFGQRLREGRFDEDHHAEFLRDQAELLFGLDALREVIPGSINSADANIQVRWRRAIDALESHRDRDEGAVEDGQLPHARQ